MRRTEITVCDLFTELQTLTDDPFGKLKELVHGHDLPLRAAEYGYIGEHYGVGGATPAIIIATRENDIKADNATVEITTGNDRYLWPLHKLYVRRHEVEEIIMRDKDMSFLKLDAEGNLTMRPTGKAQAPQAPDKDELQASPIPDIEPAQDSLSVFRKMKLTAGEMMLEFAPDMMLVIKARGTTKRVPLSEMNLMDGRKGGTQLNNQGKLVIDMAAGNPIIKGETTTSTVKTIRKIFRDKLGIENDPFSTDWKPHFKLKDMRNRARLSAEQDIKRGRRAKVETKVKKDQLSNYSNYGLPEFSIAPLDNDDKMEARNADKGDLTGKLLMALQAGEIEKSEFKIMSEFVGKVLEDLKFEHITKDEANGMQESIRKLLVAVIEGDISEYKLMEYIEAISECPGHEV